MNQCISGSQSIFEHFERGREFQHFMVLRFLRGDKAAGIDVIFCWLFFQGSAITYLCEKYNKKNLDLLKFPVYLLIRDSFWYWQLGSVTAIKCETIKNWQNWP